MRRILPVLLAVAAFPAGAAAAPVLVLGRDGRVSVRDDRFLSPAPVTPVQAVPRGAEAAAAGGRGHSPRKRPKPSPPPTVLSELARLRRTGAINQAELRSDTASFNAALATETRLTGTRASELSAVTETMHEIAASGQLTPSRLPPLFATLAANREWWTTGPLLSYGQRVEFAGSQLVWEYYPGQGIQLQVLGSFGKADGLYTAGPSQYPAMEQLLSELIPLAARRAGGLAWEYYFAFDGGSPPWTSAMSQATGLEALTRAYEATGNGYYLRVATQALPLFTAPPPAGVDVPTPVGARYLQYTFAPQASILNAFLQTLIGLDDFAHVSGNAEAARLFASGNAEAIAEVPHFDTGAWSLYQPGLEDDLSYHVLVTGFLAELCTLTAQPVYCTTAQRFEADLTTPPVVTQLTTSARAGRPITLSFRLSKESRVGVVVTSATGTVFETSATFPYGVDSVAIPGIQGPGSYGVRLAATDLAGNFSRVTGTLTISR